MHATFLRESATQPQFVRVPWPRSDGRVCNLVTVINRTGACRGALLKKKLYDLELNFQVILIFSNRKNLFSEFTTI